MPTNELQMMNKHEAAQYLQARGIELSPFTLDSLASKGGGPRFLKVGPRRRYTPQLLDEYAEKRIGKPFESTAQYAAA